MIAAAGASLLYLPPYSPDFNPIEQAFAKLKSHLRPAAERTIHGLRRVDVFGAEPAATEPAIDVTVLHVKIGELTLANDFFAGALNLGPACRMVIPVRISSAVMHVRFGRRDSC